MVRTLAVTSSPTRPSPRVAACTKPPALVAQRHGEAVDLQLARRSRTVAAVAELGQPPGRGARPTPCSSSTSNGVVERHHRHAVHDRGERGARRAADPLGRRVGRDQLGVGCSSSALQLAHQRVVLGVGDLGLVQVVVAARRCGGGSWPAAARRARPDRPSARPTTPADYRPLRRPLHPWDRCSDQTVPRQRERASGG